MTSNHFSHGQDSLVIYSQEDGAFPSMAAQCNAVRQAVALIDYTSAGYIRVTGPDAEGFLQRLLSKDLRYVKPVHSTSVYGLLLDDEAHIIGDVNVYVLDDCYLVESWVAARERVAAWLTRHASEFQVELEDATHDYAVLGIEGPYSWQVLERVTDASAISLRYKGWQWAMMGQEEGIVTRTGWSAEYGYKLFVPQEYRAELVQEIQDAGQSLGLATCGLEAMDLCMLEARFPNAMRDIPAAGTPWEAGIVWMVDAHKQDFMGRSALLAHQSQAREQVVGFIAPGQSSIAEGSPVAIEGRQEAIGTVARAEMSPYLGCPIGLAHLEQEFAVPGLTLHTLDQGDSLTTVSAPFVTPKSWHIRPQ